MWVLLAAALVAASPSPEVCAKDAPSQVSSDPDWLVKPTPENIWWAYPPNAAEALVESRVQIHCDVSVEGEAENCTVLREERPGLGFGEAALSLTKDMKFKPKIECGVPVRGEVRIPLNFALETDEKGPPAGPPPPPEAIALAKRLVEDLGLMRQIDQIPDQQVTRAMFGEGGASSTAEERKAYYEAAYETWALVRRKIEAALVGSYARRLTRLELAEAVSFYESPLGRKLIEQEHAAHSDVGFAMSEAREQMLREFQARYCAKLNRCRKPAAR